MPEPLLPDPETLLVAALNATASVTALVGSRISTNRGSTYPALVVTRVGGGPDSPASDLALLQLDCWATDDATASLLARTVVAAHRDLRRITAGGWTALTDIQAGPIPVPEEETGLARYVIDLEIQVGY